MTFRLDESGKALRSVWLTAAGRPMHALAPADPEGAGPALVLVHGLSVSGRYMVPTALRLARRFAAYVPDLPGFGRSGRPARALDIPGLTDALAAWMQELGLTRAAFLGNSLACQVLVDLAVRYPGRVRRLVLVGPAPDPGARSVLRLFGRGLLDLPREALSL